MGLSLSAHRLALPQVNTCKMTTRLAAALVLLDSSTIIRYSRTQIALLRVHFP